MAARIMPTSEPGTRAPHFFGQASITATTSAPMSAALRFGRKPRRKYEARRSRSELPSDTVPKKLSICPSAMMMAIPEVKPMTTGMGINEISRPSFKTPASSSRTPAAKQARNTP